MSLYFRELNLQYQQAITESELTDLQKLDDSFAQSIRCSLSAKDTAKTHNTSQYRQSALTDANSLTYVAWFNGHILAATQIQLNESDSHSGKIIFFKVREVTQRRGVGSFLLDELIQTYPHIQRWEIILPESLNQESANSVVAFVDAYTDRQNMLENPESVRLTVNGHKA